LTSQSLPTSALLDDLASERVRLPRERRLNMLALASLIFFTTCGGAFGLEPLIGATGAGWAIVLILITPLMWSLPISLMVAELAGLMPEEGGYYVWVRETLGRFWGVQAGCWAIFLSDPEHIGGWRTSRSGHADAVVGGSADDRVGNGGESEKREGRGPDSESRSAVRAGSVRSDDPGVAEAQRGPGSGG